MKALNRLGRAAPWAAGVVCLLATFVFADSSVPVITAIKPTRTNVLVEVQVPAGLREITVEGRARFSRGTWEPRAVVRTDGTGGALTIPLAFAKELEILRVKARPQPALPAHFYTDETAFSGPPATEVNSYGGDMIYTMTGFGGIEVRNPAEVDTGNEPREVVESDIWKIRNGTLYYFNQNRGLQLVDLRDPGHPVLRGTLSMPAVGEQMYVLNDDYAVLLARETCDAGGYQQGRVVIVRANLAAGDPVVTAALPVSGRIQESRLVGAALYVSSSVYRPVAGTTNTVWEYGTMVESFDLAQPTQPVARNSLWFSGQTDDVVAATDMFLFVANRSRENYQRSVLHVVDITAPDGQMQEYVTLHPGGHVKDKFKLHHFDGVLTTIAEDWTPAATNRMRTRLETWRLPDPRSAGPVGVTKLGEVTLGYNESLHASRFDGTRAYIVTFFQIDPLWVVDLSDPANPRIAGELEVPGWSTYIQPLGDRLVAVGWENSRTAVSLFDVSNPAQPRLHDKLLLGQHSSWSEANWDEKAFTVLPQAQLILVPYSGYLSNGYANRVQLIDLQATNLVLRGVIEHQLQPRRSALVDGRILSISGWELITVDAADRDHPEVTATLELSWPVSQVFAVGNYLLQLYDSRASYGWSQASQPAVRVTTQADPNHVLATVSLGAWPVAGATVQGQRLYVLQTPQSGYWWRYYDPYPTADSTNNFKITVLDLAALPQATVLGEYTGNHGGGWYGQQWQPVWLANGVLVWVNTQPRPYYWIMPMIWDGPVTLGRFGYGLDLWPIYGSGGGEMVAFRVGGAAPVEYVSSVNLSAKGGFQFSQPVAEGNCIYITHAAQFWQESVPVPDDYPIGEPVPWRTHIEQRHYLEVVDFTDPVEPVVRASVNVPGALLGVSHEGDMVYTLGCRYATNGWTDYRQYVSAGAYDGTAFHLVAALPLPSSLNEVLMHNGNLYYVESQYTASDASATLRAWRLDDNGKFEEWGARSFNGYFQKIAALQQWLAVQMQGDVTFLQAAPALPVAGRAPVSSCFAPNLPGADIHPQAGLFVPMDSYGVLQVPFAPILSPAQ